MRSSPTRFILGAVVLGSSLFGTGGFAGTQAQNLPFVTTLQGNALPTPTDDPCILENRETATGQSTLLGRVRWESFEVVNLCSNPDGADVEGRFVITAPNGDQVTGTYRTLAQLDFAAGEITAAGWFEVTGGTGRLEQAAGKGAIAATGSLLPPFAFEGGLFGRISF